MSAAIPKSEQDWKAQDDVRTLTEAAAIKVDKPRLSKAKKMAVKMAKEEQTKANAMKRLAKGKK